MANNGKSGKKVPIHLQVKDCFAFLLRCRYNNVMHAKLSVKSKYDG